MKRTVQPFGDRVRKCVLIAGLLLLVEVWGVAQQAWSASVDETASAQSIQTSNPPEGQGVSSIASNQEDKADLCSQIHHLTSFLTVGLVIFTGAVLGFVTVNPITKVDPVGGNPVSN